MGHPLSSNETEFNAAAPPYQEALAVSDFDQNLKYEPTAVNGSRKRNRDRQISYSSEIPGSATTPSRVKLQRAEGILSPGGGLTDRGGNIWSQSNKTGQQHIGILHWGHSGHIQMQILWPLL